MDNSDGGRPGTPSAVVGLVLVLIGVLIGWAIGVSVSDSAEVDITTISSRETAPPEPPTTSSVATPVTTTTVTPSTTVATTSTAPATTSTTALTTAVVVDPLSGAAALEGTVALAPVPAPPGDSPLWVFRAGGSVVRRVDLPFRSGGFPQPMLLTAGRLVFTNLDQAYVVDVDLVDAPQSLGEASFVVPGAIAGSVWLVGGRVAWVAPLDVADGVVGTRFDVSDTFSWPLRGYADGLIVTSADEAADSRSAYWSPTSGIQPIEDIGSSQSGVFTVSGDLAAVVSPGVAHVWRVPVWERVSNFPLDLGDGLVSEVCFSPDQRYVAVVGSTGRALIVTTHDGSIVRRLTGLHGHNSVGWTSAEQFVYIVDARAGTLVQALDIGTGAFHQVAAIRSSRGWWLAAGGAMC